ncbi:MAG: kynureninase [Aestuariivirga sp.]|uniref:kynureninase n=1 Tax=Aestuariivirga sp. TaxID=2650926 RepID=UPI0025C1C65E|nr:kynureninase [Aestuariivirga sp.]MCA3562247.1 kynureninase [Aestuariivirga sp.]
MNRSDCEALDAQDPLKHKRAAFSIPKGMIYLDGNSLGVLPKNVPARVAEVAEKQWGETLIKSWNEHGWFHLPQKIGDRLARLIGAAPGSVIAGDTISVNLFKLLGAAAKLNPSRRVILSDSGNFPSDLYVAQGFRDLMDDGYVLKVVDPEQVMDAIDGSVAFTMITEVDYRTARLHDMKAVTATAHAKGALTIWDLAHSAGATPVQLAACDADFALGCTYKYLNGGPGAPAFLYVKPELQDRVQPPLAGWWGHAAPFAFDPDYRPAPGIIRNQCGTQPILSLAALDAALDVWDGVDMNVLRQKSLALCKTFIDLAAQRLSAHGVKVAGPRDMNARGSHVSIHHPEGYAVMQALIAANVVGDFRAPDMMRFGFTPLYTSFAEVWDAVDILARILDKAEWNQPQFLAKKAVT